MADDAPYLMPQSGDARAFARFDLSRVPSPCFVIDACALEDNLKTLYALKLESGAKIFLALKAFSMFSLAPLIAKYLDGVCASGIHEARLGRDAFCREQGEVATFSTAFKASEVPDIARLSDHVVFNSLAQKRTYAETIRAAGKQIGLRINPEHSEGTVPRYDPCGPHSRLGVPLSQVTPAHMDGLDGVHMHTLCEQGFGPLARTWAAAKPTLVPYLGSLKWINLGGGHHLTRPDYDRAGLIALIKDIRASFGIEVYLEPGEAVAQDAGILVGEVLDIVRNQMPIVITDVSATCHMPDVIEAPYRPELLNEALEGTPHRFGGPSCLAGDVIGDYKGSFVIGDRFAFLDQAHYSMVKTNTFNGIALPSIAIWNSETDALKLVRQFGYDDFRQRLS
ncbi:MAG: carboxynorspermidine decarboxylase [Pseudomonadota bacterium]